MKIIDILKFYNKEDVAKMYCKEQLPYVYELLDSLDKFELPNKVEYDAYFDNDGWLFGIIDEHIYDIAYLDLWEIFAMKVENTKLFDTKQLFKYTINFILDNFEIDEELYNNNIWKERKSNQIN